VKVPQKNDKMQGLSGIVDWTKDGGDGAVGQNVKERKDESDRWEKVVIVS
jgi:hypothetical protein